MLKANQPTLLRRSGSMFQYPVWQVGQPASRLRVARTVDKGHGRLEIRTLKAYGQLGKRLSWPGVRQVLRRTCWRVDLPTGKLAEVVDSAVTSLPPEAMRGAELEQLWRGQGVIANRMHYVRDVTLGEDGGQGLSREYAPSLSHPAPCPAECATGPGLEGDRRYTAPVWCRSRAHAVAHRCSPSQTLASPCVHGPWITCCYDGWRCWNEISSFGNAGREGR